MLKMEVNQKKHTKWYLLQFFFDKCENARQPVEIVNDIDGSDTVTALSPRCERSTIK